MVREITLFAFLLIFISLTNNPLLAQNVSTLNTEETLKAQRSYDGTLYLAVQENMISKEIKSQFKAQGIWIKGEYPDGTIIVSVPKNKFNFLYSKLDKAVTVPSTSVKISDEIIYSGTTGIAITFYDKLSKETISTIKNDFNITDVDFASNDTQVLIGSMDAALINALSELPEVAYISALVEEPEPLNDVLTAYHYAGLANSELGYDLQGEGMVVGLGDGGELGSHIDFNDRVVNYAAGTYSSYGSHGDKMAGIITGAGNLIEKNRGHAPKATIITQKTYRIFYYLDDYYNNDGMRITNNSYGASFNCTNTGSYDYYSRMMDQQLVDYDDVLHIVAAGNSGGNTCNSYPLGYNTVLKTYASAKNVLTVGALNLDGSINSTSSQGPVQDGRIKPEITGLSQGITSTSNNYNYGGISGTSAATANVTGATTLIYERYKDINGGTNPQGSLIKAIMCNSADDAGNPGPDFQYGFGIMNVQQAIDIIDDGNYITGTTSTEGTAQEFNITIPAGKNQFKVLMTWNDIPQPLSGVATLINDLDLEIEAPDGSTVLPWVLDHSAANVANNATRGLDRINNIEQVTIDSPQGGTYKIKVKTYNLDTPSQKFSIAYMVNESDIKISYPTEGTSINPGDDVLISWKSDLSGVTGYQVDYSLDNGSTWNNVGTATATEHSILWTTENTNTENAKVRVTALGSGEIVTSSRFNILDAPSGLALNAPCGSYVQVDWNVTPSAVSYDIYMLDGKEMTKIGSTTENTFMVEKELIAGDDYWFSVKAKYLNGNTSQRAEAKVVTIAGTYPCTWNDDVEITQFSAGASKGRELTSNSLSNAEHLTLKLFNAGANAVSNIPISITINDVVTTEILEVELNPGDDYIYTTDNTFDFSTSGIYTIKVEPTLAGDIYSINDGLELHCTQLQNQLVSLPTYEFMEGLPTDTNISTSTFGIEQFDYLDYNNPNDSGQLKIETETGMGKIFNLTNGSVINSSELVLTRNLGNTEKTFFKLNYKITELAPGASVALEIRPSDEDAWITIENLDITNTWNEDPMIVPMSNIISELGKSFTTSTQLRFVLLGKVELRISQMSIVDEDHILPVELSSFSATRIEENVMLRWITATEENNDYFEIQVAMGDEAYQNDDFKVLDIVNGHGTTAEEMQYAYNDIENFKSGVRYYRLKQVDFDGTYTYSNSIPVYFDNDAVTELTVYPNPIMSGINPNIYLQLNEAAEINFILSDASGRVLNQFTRNFEAGAIDFTLEMNPNLDPGIYYLFSTWGKNNEVVSKIVKTID